MAQDLDIPVEIRPCATVREPNGLAMSSRNARLTDAERMTAPKLAAALFEAADRIAGGAPVDETLAKASARIVAAGFASIEYLELRAEDDLVPMHTFDRPARLLAAAWLGEIRLIDNVRVQPAD